MNATPPYRIPAETARVEIEIMRSRFIGTATFTPTVADAKAFLSTIRAEMPDATHHVHAFRVGYGNSITEGMSDDGEPSGTAGPPVLAVLRGADLGDVIVVVTRYFGGTKLGTGGLVRAYGDTAREVLGVLKTELKIERSLVGLQLAYHYYQPIRQMIDRFEGQVTEEDFAVDVTIMALFPAANIASFRAAVIEFTAGNVEPIVMNS